MGKMDDVQMERIGKLGKVPVDMADQFWSRFLGFMGQKKINKGLFLTPCRAVHTLFMREPIDILFVDVEGRVLQTVANAGPWKLYSGPQGSYSVLELPAGTLKQNPIALGERVVLFK